MGQELILLIAFEFALQQFISRDESRDGLAAASHLVRVLVLKLRRATTRGVLQTTVRLHVHVSAVINCVFHVLNQQLLAGVRLIQHKIANVRIQRLLGVALRQLSVLWQNIRNRLSLLSNSFHVVNLLILPVIVALLLAPHWEEVLHELALASSCEAWPLGLVQPGLLLRNHFPQVLG